MCPCARHNSGGEDGGSSGFGCGIVPVHDTIRVGNGMGFVCLLGEAVPMNVKNKRDINTYMGSYDKLNRSKSLV